MDKSFTGGLGGLVLVPPASIVGGFTLVPSVYSSPFKILGVSAPTSAIIKSVLAVAVNFTVFIMHILN